MIRIKQLSAAVLLFSGFSAFAQYPDLLQPPDSTVRLVLNEETQEWANITKTINKVTEDGTIVTHGYKWDSDSAKWDFSSKSEEIKDSSHHSLIEYTWNSYADDWIRSEWFEEKTDVNGNIILNISYDEYSKRKEEWLYDDENRVLVNAVYKWDAIKRDWTYEINDSSEYDDRGNRIYHAVYFEDFAGMPSTSRSKISYTYDSDGYILAKSNTNWDPQAQKWELYKKEETSYDEQKNILSESLFFFDTESEQWELHSHIQNKYEEGKLMQTVRKVQDTATGATDTISIAMYSYGTDGTQTAMIYANGDSLKEIAYEINDTAISMQYSYDAEKEEWLKIKSKKQLFDEQGNQVYESFHSTDPLTGEKTAFLYKSVYEDGELVDFHIEHWDTICECFHDLTKIEETLNENGWLESCIYYVWDAENCDWKKANKSEWLYNKYNYRFIIWYSWDEASQEWIQAPQKYSLVQYFGDEMFVDGIEKEYTGIEQTANLTFTLSPNPATAQALLYLADTEENALISIFDSNGREVKRLLTTQPETLLKLSAYAEGIYYVNIKKGDRRISIPLLVKK